MYKYVLDETKAGYNVYVDLISSDAGHYLSRRPHLIAIIKEVLSQKDLKGSRLVIEQDMGRGIGTTDVVSTNDKDSIYYAQSLKSKVFSRFAKNRSPQVSNLLTIIAERDEQGNYEVVDTWIGANRPAFPGDEYETNESREYWENHALVQDALTVQSKSITKTCPY